MEDTGRIRRTLDWRAQHVLFNHRLDRAIDDELRWYVQIDRAHLVMLAERKLVAASVASRLLDAIAGLVGQDYAPLRGRAAPRGVYLLYEHWLIETLGERIGGAGHLGRSRNDMNATILRLRLRRAYIRLVREMLRLLAVLIRRAERHADWTMPIYTHYQAALPITYGHYLAGIACALLRDLRGIEHAARELARSPMGAGAAGGTTLPIDTKRTARLLGFTGGVLHSVDAVASRDLVLRLLAAVSIAGVTLSRLAADLQLWSTAEFDFIRFPDELVGSSSMLPQKRNPFLLEHIKGRAGAPLGALTAASMAMHATPFSNSIAVGAEGVAPLWQALDTFADAIVLARLAIAGAQPQRERMCRSATLGFTPATELANRLVREAGFSFRQAHHRLGELVGAVHERGGTLEDAAASLFSSLGLPEPGDADASAVAANAAYGGGPAAPSLQHTIDRLRRGWTAGARRLSQQARRWSGAARSLDLADARIRLRHASTVEAAASR